MSEKKALKKCPKCERMAEAVNLGPEGIFWECECGYEEAIEGTVEEIERQLGLSEDKNEVSFEEFLEGLDTLRESKRDFSLKTSTTWENGNITKVEITALTKEDNNGTVD